jgi:hypothetical protein
MQNPDGSSGLRPDLFPTSPDGWNGKHCALDAFRSGSPAFTGNQTESVKPSGTLSLPPATRPQSRAFLMSSPSSPALRQLHRLNSSSSGFHNELSNILYGQEYTQCVPNLQGDDLAWLVDYLDRVRRHVVHSTLLLSQRRLSVASILSVPVTGNVYASSEVFVAPE